MRWQLSDLIVGAAVPLAMLAVYSLSSTFEGIEALQWRVGRGLLLAATSLSVAALSLEIGVRLLGYRSRQPFHINTNEPVMHQEDPALGWRNKPGHYRYAGYSPGAPDIEVTILEDGTRVTGEQPAHAEAEVILIGCSFAFGHALDDRESLGWQLQQRLPRSSVRNHAVNGYGTYQALLLLEEVLARRHGRRPLRVVFGLVESHDVRSVADPGWLRAVAQFSRSGIAAVPWARLLPDGRLERHPPIRYTSWPLHAHSALVALVEQRAGAWAGRARTDDPWGVAEKAIAEMDALTRSRGGRFSVASLYLSPRASNVVRSDLRKAGIRFIDCVVKPYPLPARLRVAGEGHPNGQVSAAWADCLAEEIDADDGADGEVDERKTDRVAETAIGP